MRVWLLVSVFPFLAAGCAGKMDVIRPGSYSMSNVKTIEKPREQVWNASVPELVKHFFVKNNLDKSSGLIKVSYRGDPEKYVDCGRV